VQDYHLLLTPSYILRKVRSANIGLFLHVPFPSSEVFRALSVRKELLRGMLNADHIGFHLFEYARHFMSACKRILGLTYKPMLRGQLGVDYGGRRVAVTCSHMAIDAARIEQTLDLEDVRERVVELRQKHLGKQIMAGCDTVERLKGIPSKILAFDGVSLGFVVFFVAFVSTQQATHSHLATLCMMSICSF
jgi:trehalose 6-phosphate synthase/phosphatase